MAELFNLEEKSITRTDGWDLTPNKSNWETSYELLISEKRLMTRIKEEEKCGFSSSPNLLTGPETFSWVWDGRRQLLGLCQRGEGWNSTVGCQQLQLPHFRLDQAQVLLFTWMALPHLPALSRWSSLLSAALPHRLLGQSQYLLQVLPPWSRVLYHSSGTSLLHHPLLLSVTTLPTIHIES